jgi:3-deoxy-D-manno-octulosonate 8-phosphate phosphatase KdsC-like HAD superfamily phosphatase
MFREAVKEFNVRRGKNIRFLKNERRKCIVVCKDPKCYYRVYA